MVIALKYSSAAPATHTQGQRAHGTLVACRLNPRAIAAVLPCHVAAIQPCGSGAAAAGGSKVFRKISCQVHCTSGRRVRLPTSNARQCCALMLLLLL